MKTSNKPTKQELLEAIKSALDCNTHFTKPTIVGNDPNYTYGQRAMVVCHHCVEKFENLVERSGIPHYEFQKIRASVVYRRKT